jgi:septal ring factor EnvC (AmiA/AmiB activator)
MKKAVLLVFFLALIPFFVGCENKQLQEENANLKKQVGTLTTEKTTLQSNLDAAKKETASLSAERESLKKQVGELTNQIETMKAQMAKKPAKKSPSTKK